MEFVNVLGQKKRVLRLLFINFIIVTYGALDFLINKCKDLSTMIYFVFDLYLILCFIRLLFVYILVLYELLF